MNRFASTPYRAVTGGLALGLIGLLLNWLLPIEIYYKLSLLLGSICALLALDLLGGVAGVLAGLLSASGTLLLWGQPFPFAVLGTEIVIIALLRRRISSNLMVAASLYWLLIGGPLVWGLYHLVMGIEPIASTVYALKFCVNGIFNALLASLFLMAIRTVRFRSASDPALRIPFAEALALLLTAVVFIPTLIATVVNLRVELLEREQQLHKISQQVTESSQQVFTSWFQDWAKTLNALGNITDQVIAMPVREQQQQLRLLVATDPSILSIGLLDRTGRVIAQDEQGQTMMGLDFSRLPDVAQAIKTHKPISRTYCLGDRARTLDVVLMVQPVLHSGKLDGFAAALIDLQKFNARLQFVAQRRHVQITVLDQTGAIVASSASQPMLTAQPGITMHHPPKKPSVPWLDVMRQVSLVSRGPFGDDMPWEMVVETPYAPIVKELNLRAVSLLGMLFGLITTVVFVAQMVSRRFSSTIHTLEQCTSSLPSQISRGELPVWPDSILKEVGELSSNAQEMATSLSDAFQELKTINDSLERRVEKRTAELRETAKKLEDARNEAEAACSAKGRFLAVMSHEIRTPMNAIMGITTLLRETPLNKRQRELLDYANDASSSLLQIINDVLDFSRVEANQLKIIHEPFSLKNLLEALRSLFGVTAKQKGLSLDLVLREGVPDLLLGDGGRLRQVLANLVGNAVKFTETGRIVLEVEALSNKTGQSGLWLRFSVSDTGIGIPLDKQDLVFDMFSQVDDTSTRRFGGTGLGLAISRQLVELMGGTMAVRSKPGEGSCFFFELPVEQTTTLPALESNSMVRQHLPRLRILLAEDNPANQLVSREFLMALGQEVVLASNGLELLAALEGQQFDLVLTDISMPEMDGLQAVAIIRSGERPGVDRHIPVIAMTAHAFAEDRERFMLAGLDGYVTKPVEIRQLIDELRRVMPNRFQDAAAVEGNDTEQQTRKTAMTEPTNSTVAGDDPLDRNYLERNYLALGCADVLTDVVAMYLESVPVKMGGLQAALAAHDDVAFAKLIHGLKGESGSVGAHLVTARAAALEQQARQGNLAACRSGMPDLERELQRAIAVLEREFTA